MELKNIATAIRKNNDALAAVSLWKTLGKVEKDASCGAYIRDQVIRITTKTDITLPGNENACPLLDSIVYVRGNYLGKIDWETTELLSLDGMTVTDNGLNVQAFMCLAPNVDFEAFSLDEIPDFDFDSYKEEQPSILNIDPRDWAYMLSPTGVPFVTEEELEYNYNQFVDTFIFPTVQDFYASFPIVKKAAYNVGGQFSIKFPDDAYNAVMWTSGSGSAGGNSNGILTAFGLIATEGSYLGYANGRFGRGVYYNKRVPGYSGLAGRSTRYTNQLGQNLINQTLRNVYTREQFDRVLHDDGWYAEGYTTNPGALNVKWLCWNPDWSVITIDLKRDIRELGKARMMQGLGWIRGMCKSTANLKLNEDKLSSEGKAIEDKILQKWDESPYSKIFTPARGSQTY